MTARTWWVRLALLAVIAVMITVLFAAPPAQAEELITVKILRPNGVTVRVFTDNQWRHWRQWPVTVDGDRLSRGEVCRHRIDARRVLRHKRVTQGLPNRCQTREQRARKPDAWARAAMTVTASPGGGITLLSVS